MSNITDLQVYAATLLPTPLRKSEWIVNLLAALIQPYSYYLTRLDVFEEEIRAILDVTTNRVDMQNTLNLIFNSGSSGIQVNHLDIFSAPITTYFISESGTTQYTYFLEELTIDDSTLYTRFLSEFTDEAFFEVYVPDTVIVTDAEINSVIRRNVCAGAIWRIRDSSGNRYYR